MLPPELPHFIRATMMEVMKTSFQIDGMSCDHCVAHVKEEVGRIPGVTGTTLTLAGAVLTVESDAPIDFPLIRAAVEEAGDYTATEIP